MVSKLGLVGGHGFEPPLWDLNICSPFVYLKVHIGLCLHLVCFFPHVGMGPHVRESIKDMIFILSPNPSSLKLVGK